MTIKSPFFRICSLLLVVVFSFTDVSFATNTSMRLINTQNLAPDPVPDMLPEATTLKMAKVESHVANRELIESLTRDDIVVPEVNKIAVIGGGTMGAAFAYTAALNGIQVVVKDVDWKYLKRAKRRIEKAIDGGIKAGKIEPDKKNDFKKRIQYTVVLEKAIRDADVIFEAIVEDIDAKKALFEEISHHELTRDDAIIISNTSSLKVSDIAEGAKNPGMVGGMHFFDPVWSQKIVEVIYRENIDPRVIKQSLNLARRMGKDPVLSHDSPGFIYNRIFVPLIAELLRLVDEEGISPETVNAASADLFGLPRTAETLWYMTASNNKKRNKSGLDITKKSLDALYEQMDQNPFYEPPKILTDREKDIKKGKGLWEIDLKDSSKIDRSKFREIQERLSGVVFTMAGQLIDEGVAIHEFPHQIIDQGIEKTFKWGVGGVFELMNKLGIEESQRRVALLTSETYPSLDAPESLATLSRQKELWPLEYVHLKVEGDVGIITIDRPGAMNALNENVIRDLRKKFEEATQDPNVKVIMLRGEGTKAFVSGADIGFFLKNRTREKLPNIVRFAREGQELFHEIDVSEKPVAVYVNGYALGGGLELALTADAIFAGENIDLAFPEVTQVGIIPGLGGTYRAARKLGKEIAKWLILTGKHIKKVEEAMKIGLVDHKAATFEDALQQIQAFIDDADDITPEIFREKFSRPDDEKELPEGVDVFDNSTITEIIRLLEASSEDVAAARLLRAVNRGAPRARFLANQLIEANAKRETPGVSHNELAGLDIFLTQNAGIGLLATARRQPPEFVNELASFEIFLQAS